MCLNEITVDAVEKFKVDLVQQCSKATVNRHLALLRHILNKKGFKANNPVSNARLFREENTRIRWLNVEEEQALLAVTPEPYRTFCRVALYTGCRRSELLSARWDQIDWNRNVLVLPTSKNGKPKVVELSSVVVACLKHIPRRIGEDLIFHDCGNVSHRFPEWVKDAELTGIVSFHTLRHTFASRLVMAGVDLLTVQSRGGWRDLAMVQRYAPLAPAHRREAIEALARGETLQRTGTHTGTKPQKASQTDSAGSL